MHRRFVMNLTDAYVSAYTINTDKTCDELAAEINRQIKECE